MNNEKLGMKFDGAGEDKNTPKPRWELILWKELAEVVKVLTAGGIKYQDFNWIHVRPINRYIGALQRHFNDWLEGKEYDEDIFSRTGWKVNHLACLMCNALFLMWFDKHVPNWKKEEFKEYLDIK